MQPDKSSPFQLSNQFFDVFFDINNGAYNIQQKDGSPLIMNAIAEAFKSSVIYRTSDSRYTYSLETVPFDNILDTGSCLKVSCQDDKKVLNFEIHILLFEHHGWFGIETICKNISSRDINIERINPITITTKNKGQLVLLDVTKVLTNGKMYYDPGRLETLSTNTPITSWWNLCLYRGDTEQGLVAGYLENTDALGEFKVSQDSAGRINLEAISSYGPGFQLKPGASITSNRVIFIIESNPFKALETYAGALQSIHNPKLNPAINGWCTWFNFYGLITEEEVIRQTDFAARYLKPFGFEYIQVDDGFYRVLGDWEANDRFPHGMKWLADEIRKRGLKPGIWFAPYCIAAGTEVYEKHPEWLLRTTDGRLKACAPDPRWAAEEQKKEKPGLCGLDITHPDAARWLHDLFYRASHEWGYEFFKIDFVDWTILAADCYYEPAMTRAQVYRKGIEIMREAIGPAKHLLDCGPGSVSAGLIDSMRIELDMPPPNWNQYFLQSASSAAAAAKRYYFHNRTWINDADHICMNLLTNNQAEAVASIIALSGGNTISGDRMSNLDTVQLDILRKAFPTYGKAARPVDLFVQDIPEIFALDVKKDFDAWKVVGFFNADETKEKIKTINIQQIDLDPTKTYVAFDFWEKRFYGEIKNPMDVRVEPSSVVLLSIHEKRNNPFVISTDRHISQGGMEIENVTWDEKSGILRGVALGSPGTEYRIYIYLPNEHAWAQTHPYFFYDFPGYTAKIMEPHILRIHVRFENTDRVCWEFKSNDWKTHGVIPR